MEQDILAILSQLGTSPDNCVPILQKVQEKYGYLPRQAMDLVVKNSSITAGQLYGVATFYSQFRLNPVGRHRIKICHGTACHVRGADRLNTAVRYLLNLKEDEETSAEEAYTLEDVACVGCCSLAPVMVIDNDVHGDLTGPKANQILKKHAKDNNEKI